MGCALMLVYRLTTHRPPLPPSILLIHWACASSQIPMYRTLPASLFRKTPILGANIKTSNEVSNGPPTGGNNFVVIHCFIIILLSFHRFTSK